MNESSSWSIFLANICLDVSGLNFGHSIRCVVVVFHFNLHFNHDIRCGATFHKLICHLCIFFGEVSVQIFCPFFKIKLFIFCCEFKNSFISVENPGSTAKNTLSSKAII